MKTSIIYVHRNMLPPKFKLIIGFIIFQPMDWNIRTKNISTNELWHFNQWIGTFEIKIFRPMKLNKKTYLRVGAVTENDNF